MPKLHECVFVEEKVKHKLKGKYVKMKEEEGGGVGVSVSAKCVPWQRYLQGKLLLVRWPNEKVSFAWCLCVCVCVWMGGWVSNGWACV